MGSVMDQERPWEEERPDLSTIKARVMRSLQFGQGSAILQIIEELERLEKKVDGNGKPL